MTKNTEKEFWQDIDVYSVNTEPRSAAGFPRDEASGNSIIARASTISSRATMRPILI